MNMVVIPRMNSSHYTWFTSLFQLPAEKVTARVEQVFGLASARYCS